MELPGRLDLISLLKIAGMHQLYTLAPPPFCVLLLSLDVVWKIEDPVIVTLNTQCLTKVCRRPCHTLDIQSYNEMSVEATPLVHV